jgi:Ni/Fe-hydrogenase subunit HybB-like protein
MLIGLSGAIVVTLSLYLVIRFADLIIAGKLPLMFNSGWLSIVFWVEIGLFAVPLFVLMNKQRRSQFPVLLRTSILIMLAGAAYRFNSYITAYRPAPGQTYFPSFLEVFITAGVIALEISMYYWIVKRYPILGGATAQESAA